MARYGYYDFYANGNVYHRQGYIPSGYRDKNGDGIPDSSNARHYFYRDTITGAQFSTFGDPGNKYYQDIDTVYVPKGYGYLYGENIFGGATSHYQKLDIEKLKNHEYYRDIKGYFHEKGYGFIWDYDAPIPFWNYGKIADFEHNDGVRYIDPDKDAIFTKKTDPLSFSKFFVIFSPEQDIGKTVPLNPIQNNSELCIDGKSLSSYFAYKLYQNAYQKYDTLLEKEDIINFVKEVSKLSKSEENPVLTVHSDFNQEDKEQNSIKQTDIKEIGSPDMNLSPLQSFEKHHITKRSIEYIPSSSEENKQSLTKSAPKLQEDINTIIGMVNGENEFEQGQTLPSESAQVTKQPVEKIRLIQSKQNNGSLLKQHGEQKGLLEEIQDHPIYKKMAETIKNSEDSDSSLPSAIRLEEDVDHYQNFDLDQFIEELDQYLSEENATELNTLDSSLISDEMESVGINTEAGSEMLSNAVSAASEIETTSNILVGLASVGL